MTLRSLLAYGLAAIAAMTACSNTPPDPAEAARLTLAGARRCLGPSADGVETIHTRAVVQGPESQFVTLIWSGRDGRARMEQSSGFIAVNHPAGAWQLDPRSGQASPLENEVLSFVAGHELHMTALDASSRYRNARSVGKTSFQGRDALAVEFSGYFGEPVIAYFAANDTLPLGITLTQPDPDVIVTFDDWDTVDGIRVFTSAEFAQDAETHRYAFTDIQINSTVDSVFVGPDSHLK